MLIRTRYLNKIHQLLANNPIVCLMGTRQVGKTTLARMLAKSYHPVTFFDLENPNDLNYLKEPMLALEQLTGLVIIDEIQQKPELFNVLRVLADRTTRPSQFLVLGS